MAYNKDAHAPLKEEVDYSLEDLKQQIRGLSLTVQKLLKGKGAQLSGVSVKTLDNLELLPVDQLTNVHANGQTVADPDIMLIYDTSRSLLRHITVDELYRRYLNSKIPRAHGTEGELQLKGPGGGGNFTTSGHLRFKNADQTLLVNGTLATTHLSVGNSISTNIDIVDDPTYDVGSFEHTVLAQTIDNHVVINLPPPGTAKGRLLNFKKIGAPNTCVLLCRGNLIDGDDSHLLKNNNSTCTLQCDGESWWVIAKNGT
jgi:hypothetical protein